MGCRLHGGFPIGPRIRADYFVMRTIYENRSLGFSGGPSVALRVPYSIHVHRYHARSGSFDPDCRVRRGRAMSLRVSMDSSPLRSASMSSRGVGQGLKLSFQTQTDHACSWTGPLVARAV